MIYYSQFSRTTLAPQAVDLVAFREVAVKIHQLTPQWSEEKKASYVKHAVRRQPGSTQWVFGQCPSSVGECLLLHKSLTASLLSLSGHDSRLLHYTGPLLPRKFRNSQFLNLLIQ